MEDIKILDGGLCTDLFINGGFVRAEVNKDPLWSARVLYEKPEEIMKAHLRFIKAGSDVVSTCSYQASVQGYMEHAQVTKEKAEKIIGSSVDVAKQAVQESGRRVLVAGSISPYGAILHDMSEYTGSYIDTTSEQQLSDFHKTNIRILASKGVDLFAFETLPSLKEALVLAEILREYPTLKAWVSFSNKNGTHTCYGEPFEEVFKALGNYHQIIAIGLNCCKSETISSFIQLAHGNLAKHQRLIIYPNNCAGGNVNSSEAPLEWLPKVKTWLESNLIGWIGGCCMTSPFQIGQIKQAVMEWQCEKK
uniref:homocysteine S-methyltransferase 1-like n=1 Tax=Ciona intestinalis TaxID=7719 RepID=UPI000180BE5F|nr:homocysteine S-methyltransferase 1-like [Ciona intestinalis]|eukprot:XP_026691022.1 homocysteine S-methyltransferase 1-like [Ciona intestinalis]